MPELGFVYFVKPGQWATCLNADQTYPGDAGGRGEAQRGERELGKPEGTGLGPLPWDDLWGKVGCFLRFDRRVGGQALMKTSADVLVRTPCPTTSLLPPKAWARRSPGSGREGGSRWLEMEMSRYAAASGRRARELPGGATWGMAVAGIGSPSAYVLPLSTCRTSSLCPPSPRFDRR